MTSDKRDFHPACRPDGSADYHHHRVKGRSDLTARERVYVDARTGARACRLCVRRRAGEVIR